MTIPGGEGRGPAGGVLPGPVPLTVAEWLAYLRKAYPHHGILCDAQGMWHAVLCVNKRTFLARAYTAPELAVELARAYGNSALPTENEPAPWKKH